MELQGLSPVYGILEQSTNRECLNVGAVPTFKMHNIGTVPMFKMHCFTESSRTPFLGLASPFQSDINCMEEECAVQKAPF